jgi:NAD(P)-dependent dehydrogenase (short-subunit alcohol dehydrogenase family)
MSVLWQYQERPDLRDAVVLVTGASSGVGAAAARAFAETGARVLLAVRDPGKARAVVGAIADAVPGASLEIVRVDLGDLTSVRELAEAVVARHRRLDLLINNAAVAAVPRRLTVDGFEEQMGVAHLGHFALTGRLLPLLLGTPGARVVTVTSAVAARPQVDLDDLQSERDYRRYRAYAQAKSANMLFALELRRRLEESGSDVRSLAAQPGWTRSGLGPGPTAGRVERGVIALTGAVFAHAPEVGVQPILMAALADLPGGTYVTRRHLNALKGAPVAVPPERIRAEPAQQSGLWAASERLTGVVYDFGAVSGARARGEGEPGRGL